LTVTTPNGGQQWIRGTIHSITWSSTGSPGANVKIELLKGGVVNSVLASSTPNDGSYSWTISSTQTLGTDYKVRITSTTNTAVSDSSNSNFAVVAGTVTVTTPNGGNSWIRGTSHTITWSKSGSPGSYVKIELLKGGVVNRVITSSTANDGSYSWTISSTQTTGTDYKIRITSTSYSSITDSSNSNFAITT
jgi:5-hydroxyisourate hydrolase-like protein (transthyretin family)